MDDQLRRQDRTAARSRLIEPQIEGFKVDMMYIHCMLISLAFENCVGYCTSFSIATCTVIMRVKGHMQNSIFKRK